MSPEFDTIVKTAFVHNSAATTNSIQGQIITNSLLQTGATVYTMYTNSMQDELAALYTAYRVVGYSLKYEAVSRSTVDVLLTQIESNEDLTPTFTTGSFWLASPASNDQAQLHVVPANTKSPCLKHVKVGKVMLADLVGSDTFETDDNYAGTISSSGVPTTPADVTTSFVIMTKTDSAAFTASTSPYLAGTMLQWVKFYGRRRA
jgi:hypothetical protein